MFLILLKTISCTAYANEEFLGAALGIVVSNRADIAVSAGQVFNCSYGFGEPYILKLHHI